jgi:hypothetical protein
LLTDEITITQSPRKCRLRDAPIDAGPPMLRTSRTGPPGTTRPKAVEEGYGKSQRHFGRPARMAISTEAVMKGTDIIGAVSITDVFIGLGGDPPRKGHARAFWRDGDNPQAVALNDARGCWYGHRDHIGGVLGCTTRRILCSVAPPLFCCSRREFI